MNIDRRRAVAALTAAGLLWGTTVPLSKLALEWLPPGWLAFVRFALAAAILLAATSRRGLRGACTPLVLASGAVGYGGSVLLQNAGITRTSVSHAALLIGAVPMMVAVIAARVLLSLFRAAFDELGAGRIKLNGFYPEWAQPTFQLVRALPSTGKASFPGTRRRRNRPRLRFTGRVSQRAAPLRRGQNGFRTDPRRRYDCRSPAR